MSIVITTCHSNPSCSQTWSAASSLMYTGLYMLSIQIPAPDSNLGTSSTVMFTAAAFSDTYTVKTKVPHNMVGLRPYLLKR